jgi:indole-3-glycerol phosphate synthase
VSTDFLTEMAAASTARVRDARRTVPESLLAERARQMPAAPPRRIDPSGFDLIAELKLRSPASGALGTAHDGFAQRLSAYAGAGAAAVSVLTEPSRFDGSLAHLTEAARHLAPLRVPVMRKDFLVDPYQVLEARVAGAAGVLVIVRMLSRETLAALIERAAALQLFVLLEAFDARDLALVGELIAAHGASAALLAGVNCRDLATLEVVPQRLLDLAPLLPAGVPRVAESGVTSGEDARRVVAAGYTLVLVGSALMQDADPLALAQTLIAAGRAAAGAR